MFEVEKFVEFITDYDKAKNTIVNENLQKYNFSCTCLSLKKYNNGLVNYLTLISDNLILTIKEENVPNAILVYNNTINTVKYFEDNYKNLINILNENIDDDDNFLISINFNIIKKNSNKISIYNIMKFEEYLNNNTYEDIIDSFDNIYKNYNNIEFINNSFSNCMLTESISFTNGEGCQCLFNRINYIKGRKKFCINSKELNICPNDFHIIDNNIVEFKKFENHFKQIENILCIEYLSNFSHLNKNSLTYRINGNKILNGNIDIKKVNLYNKNLYDVYSWIYSDINVSEKISICRTIIAMTYDNIIDVDDTLLNTLESNFRIYMIENVERYINVKTALTNQILETINRLNDEYKNFYRSFKNNMFLFISSFLGFFIIDLGNTDTSYLYSAKMYPIMFIFLLGSLIWAIIGYFEIKNKLDIKNKKTLENLIINYKDVLANDQINSMFNALLSDDLSNLQLNSKKYFILWVSIIILILIILTYQTYNVKILELIKIIYTNILTF